MTHSEPLTPHEPDAAPPREQQPRVLVVIVHHRGAEILDRCLVTLATSEGVEIEVVVVSNACDEPLPASVEATGCHVVQSAKSLGFSAANNLGVGWASRHLAPFGAYLFLNNDTRVARDSLAILVRRLLDEERCGVVGPLLVIDGARDHLNSLGLNVTEIGEAWDEGIGRSFADYGPLPDCREVLAVTGAALCIRPEIFRKVGGWPELYGFYNEDIDLCLRVWELGWQVRNEPASRIAHHISATAGQASDFKIYLSWRNQILLLVGHWPLLLLLRVGPRFFAAQAVVFVKRLRFKAYRDAKLQARAWAMALVLMPRALLRRLGGGRRRDWTRFLVPAGSVPVIELPEGGAVAAEDPV